MTDVMSAAKPTNGSNVRAFDIIPIGMPRRCADARCADLRARLRRICE
ncbi:hypothetical protein [Lysobacter sp. cf310]|nr:hypothetical protein [Lysobacter sp. cf310]